MALCASAADEKSIRVRDRSIFEMRSVSVFITRQDGSLARAGDTFIFLARESASEGSFVFVGVYIVSFVELQCM